MHQRNAAAKDARGTGLHGSMTLRCLKCFRFCTALIHAGTANAIRGGMLAVALSIVVGAYLYKGDSQYCKPHQLSGMQPPTPRWSVAGRQVHPVIEQFPALKLRGLPEFQGPYAEDTLWGTYRSGQYLGMLHCCTRAA